MSPVIRRVLLGNSLSAIGSGLTMPLLIVYLGQVRGLGTATAGLVVAWMAVVQLLLMPATGILVDRLGPRPALMGGLLVNSAGVALLATVSSTASAFAICALVAAGGAFVWSPQAALLGRLTTPEARQRVFGIQFMLLNLGIGIGGIVAAVVVDVTAPTTFSTLYLLDALTYLAYLAVLLTLRGVGVGPVAADEGDAGPGGYREVLADRTLRRLLILALVLLTCGYGSLEVGLPTVITVVNGLDVSWVALAFTVNTLSIVVLQLVVLKWIQGRSRSRLMAAVALLWAASWLVLGLTGLLPTTAAIVGVCLSTFVFALGETLWAPVAPALVNDLAPNHLRGRYNSMQGLVWGVSGALGPAVTGLLLGGGHVGAWVTVVVGGSLVAALLAARLRRHLSPELDGRVAVEGGTMPA